MKVSSTFQSLASHEMTSVQGGFSFLRFVERAVKWLGDVLTIKPTT